MARIPRNRLVAANTVNHCTWRSHNHALVLDSDDARRCFLDLLRKYKDKHGISIHSYCLMGTHPHVVCTAARGQAAFSAFWQVVNHCFARWYNRRTGGRGQVVMERLRSPQIQGRGAHQLAVMRYCDLNPVRAGLVKRARQWAWSSYRHYAHGEPDDLITDAPEYLALGSTKLERCLAYVHLFARPLVQPFLSRRADLVTVPFVGDAAWVAARLVLLEPSPPG